MIEIEYRKKDILQYAIPLTENSKESAIAPVCIGQIIGFGFYGYAMALSYFSDNVNRDEHE